MFLCTEGKPQQPPTAEPYSSKKNKKVKKGRRRKKKTSEKREKNIIRYWYDKKSLCWAELPRNKPSSRGHLTHRLTTLQSCFLGVEENSQGSILISISLFRCFNTDITASEPSHVTSILGSFAIPTTCLSIRRRYAKAFLASAQDKRAIKHPRRIPHPRRLWHRFLS